MKLDFETGIGEVQYGMLRREVAQIMGEPEHIENQDGKIDGFCDERWHYNDSSLGRVDLCCTFRVQQCIGSHINMNASDNMPA